MTMRAPLGFFQWVFWDVLTVSMVQPVWGSHTHVTVNISVHCHCQCKSVHKSISQRQKKKGLRDFPSRTTPDFDTIFDKFSINLFNFYKCFIDDFKSVLSPAERDVIMKKYVEELEDWKERQQELFKLQVLVITCC